MGGATPVPPPGPDGVRGGVQHGFHRLGDALLRGLLNLLAGDGRLSAFTARELGPVLEHDTHTGSRLIRVLWYLCAHGGTKSAAAAAHMSQSA